MASMEGCIAQSTMGPAEPWAFGWEPWTPPTLEDLLPELSCEERLRLQGHLREHERILKRPNKISPPLPSLHSEEERDAFIIPHVRHALRHYNTRHPDDEFDAVKPLMEASARFRGQIWYHVNFWARSRKSNKIKRFFAEVHYKPPTLSSACLDRTEVDRTSGSSVTQFPAPIPFVEACTIIEEPLNKYRKSCAFCTGNLDILHPVGSRKFVCGNDKDRFAQQFKPCKERGWLAMPFISLPGSASNRPEEETKESLELGP